MTKTSANTAGGVKPEKLGPRSRRPRGERSREKILAAAREIVVDRGYDGTSMAEVSRRCGLPTSSIYWHFSDKDDLMSHVIRDSFRTWSAIWDISTDIDVLEDLPQIFDGVRLALRDSPEFLRLGLQLALQQRTDDPLARRMYLEHRRDATSKLNQIAQSHFPMIPPDTRASVVTFLIAAIDGLFIAREIDPDVDIDRQIAVQLKAVVLLIGAELGAAQPDDTPTSTSMNTNLEGATVDAPTQEQLDDLAGQLRSARDNASEVQPPTELLPGLTVEQAYQVQSVNRAKDLEAGHRIVGHKIGLTSVAMQKQLGVDQPDYGYLTDRMVIADGEAVGRSAFVAPRAEPEIAFRLARDLDATSTPVTADDVRGATDAVAVALEIVDSRVTDWRITLVDTIADNASSAAVVLGPWVPLASAGDLTTMQAELMVDGEIVDSGVSDAVLGDPAEAVAWLVNAYGRLGETVRAGEFIMSGAICASAWIHAGNRAAARIEGLGEVSVSFTDEASSAVPEDVRPAVAAVAALTATVSTVQDTSVDYAEVVVVRPGGVPGATTEEENAVAGVDPDAEITAVTEAIEGVGVRQGKAILLINPAEPPVSPGATVTCLVDGAVDADLLRQLSASVRAAVGDRLSSDLTAAPVAGQARTCPVGSDAVAVSMTLDLTREPSGNEA